MRRADDRRGGTPEGDRTERDRTGQELLEHLGSQSARHRSTGADRAAIRVHAADECDRAWRALTLRMACRRRHSLCGLEVLVVLCELVAGLVDQRASSACNVSPAASGISRVFVRLAAPLTRTTSRFAIPKATATASTTAAVALPSTARSATRTTSMPSCEPPTPGWRLPGCTRTTILITPPCHRPGSDHPHEVGHVRRTEAHRIRTVIAAEECVSRPHGVAATSAAQTSNAANGHGSTFR